MGHVENVRRANLLQIVVSSLARCCAALGDVEKFRPPNLLQAVMTSDMASERRDWKQSREPLGSCWLSSFGSHRVQIRVFLQWRQARVFFGQFEFTRRFFSTAPVPSAARNNKAYLLSAKAPQLICRGCSRDCWTTLTSICFHSSLCRNISQEPLQLERERILMYNTYSITTRQIHRQVKWLLIRCASKS